mmetsp:Transcript_14876/g.26262  ORF Transcript_14876/g.26262 Transcript_14876/m.26262 type:complete len:107 (-) Transcript_14876:106-426(-)
MALARRADDTVTPFLASCEGVERAVGRSQDDPESDGGDEGEEQRERRERGGKEREGEKKENRIKSKRHSRDTTKIKGSNVSTHESIYIRNRRIDNRNIKTKNRKQR